MKTTESFVHKNLRAVAQASVVKKQASLAVYFGPISHRPKSL